MKTIGLIGGMSWESSAKYYQIINTVIKEKLGGLHSAKCLLYSVDFHEIEECQSTGNWEKSADMLGSIAVKLEKAGADFIVICTNTMHKVADEISEVISIPLLHIAEATAQELKASGIKRVALLGTKYTMEQDFYKSRLSANGMVVVIPESDDRIIINDIIYNELCLGIISEKSKSAFLTILDNQANQGVQAAILGCTEIGLLIQQEDTPMPLFDTAEIHARKAALFSINT